MIKIRLHGIEEELKDYVEHLEHHEEVTILSQSKLYKDRGKSEYKRIYLDVEVNKKGR